MLDKKEFHHIYTNLWRQQERDKYKKYLKDLVNINRIKYKTDSKFKKMRLDAIKKYRKKLDPNVINMYNMFYYYYRKDHRS